MADDWAGFEAQRRQQAGAASIAAGANVPPQAAIQATQAAPLSGIPAAAGMHNPEMTSGLATQTQTTGALQASPALQSFTGASQANAAAAKPDYSALANMELTWDQYKSQNGPLGDIARAFKGSEAASIYFTQRYQDEEKAGRYDFPDRIKAFLATVGAASSPFASVSEPIARGIFQIPQVHPDTPELKAQEAEFLGGFYSSFIPLPKVPRLFRPIEEIPRGGFGGEVPPTGAPQAPGGPGLGDAFATGPQGHVLGADGNPLEFGSAKDAARWILKEGYAREHNQIFEPAVLGEGRYGVRVSGLNEGWTPPQAPPGVNPAESEAYAQEAEANATAVKDLQEQLAATNLHAQAPAIAKDFLERTSMGETPVWVNPEVAAKLLQSDGAFASYAGEISSALAAGHELEIPMSQYLSETAGKPWEDEINAATRFSEAGVSQEEAKGLPQAEPLFHGSPVSDITEFKTEGLRNRTGTPGTVSFTTDRENALKYGPNVYEAQLAPGARIGDYLNPDDVQRVFDWRTSEAQFGDVEQRIRSQNENARQVPGRVFTPKTPEEIEAQVASAKKDILNRIQNGDYALWENVKLHKDLGWQGVFTHEAGARNLILSDASAVRMKQAVGMAQPETGPTISEASQVEVPQDLQDHAQEIRSIAAAVEGKTEELFKELGISQLFTEGKALAMTKAQFERYGAAIDELRAAVRDKVLDRTYNQLRRERTPEWKKEIEALTPWFEDQLNSNREVQAWKQLTEKGFKLDKDLVENFYPGSAARLPTSMLKKGGNHPDEVADFLGYDSGAQMVNNLADLADTIKTSGQKGLASWVKATAREATESQARFNLGYDASPEGLEAAAREAVTEVPMQNFLTQELRQLYDMSGKTEPFSMSDIEAQAEASFRSLPTKTAINTRTFSRNMWRLSRLAETALSKGDFAKAFDYRQQQLMNYMQLQMAYAAQKQFARFDKTLTRWAKAELPKGMDPLVGTILQDAAQKMNYPLTRDYFELKRALAEARDAGRPWDVESLNSAANAAGYPLEYLPQPETPPGVNGELPSAMKWGDFSDYMKQLQALAKFGQELHSVEIEGQRWELTDYTNQIQAAADALGRKWTAQELQDLRYTKFGEMKMKVQSILVSNLRPEVYLHWLDQQAQGPLMRVVNGLQNGKYLETDMSKAWTDAMRAVDKSGTLFRSMNQKLENPPWMDLQTVRGAVKPIRNRGNLRVALMHLGTQSGASKLLRGYGWDSAAEQWLISQATPEEWELVKAVWAENDKLFKQADEMYRRVRGVGLDKEQLRPVVTADGETIPGGYLHIQYNPGLKDLTKIQNVDNVQAVYGTRTPGGDLFSDHPAAALPSAFYSLKRTNVAYPVLLDHQSIAGGVAEVIHDIAFREALVAAQKVLMDPRTADAMRSVLGPEYAAQMAPWLRYIAQERMMGDPGSAGFASVVNAMARNATWAQVAYSLATSVKHAGVGLAHMTGEVGPLPLARAFYDTLGFGPRVKMWQDFIEQASGEVRDIKFNNDASIAELLRTQGIAEGAVGQFKELGYTLFTLFKKMEARATWLAKYRTAIAENGKHEEAVNIANLAVRNTQGAGHAVDLAPILRNSGTLGDAAKNLFLTRLMGFRSTTINRGFTIKREIGQALRGGSEAPRFAGQAATGLSAFVILASLALASFEVFLRGGGNPKEKSTAKRFAEEEGWSLAEQGPGSFPGGSLLVDSLKFDSGGDNPVSEALKTGQKVFEGKDRRPIAHGVAAFGELSGLLPVSIGNFGQAIYDQMNNELQPDDRGPVQFLQRAFLNRAPHYIPHHSRGRGHR